MTKFRTLKWRNHLGLFAWAQWSVKEVSRRIRVIQEDVTIGTDSMLEDGRKGPESRNVQGLQILEWGSYKKKNPKTTKKPKPEIPIASRRHTALVTTSLEQ